MIIYQIYLISKGVKLKMLVGLFQTHFYKKDLIFPLKINFIFYYYYSFIIFKRKSYLNFYKSKSKKTLIFDHSGKSIKKNLKIKNKIKKIFIPRRYIIKSIYKY